MVLSLFTLVVFFMLFPFKTNTCSCFMWAAYIKHVLKFLPIAQDIRSLLAMGFLPGATWKNPGELRWWAQGIGESQQQKVRVQGYKGLWQIKLSFILLITTTIFTYSDVTYFLIARLGFGTSKFWDTPTATFQWEFGIDSQTRIPLRKESTTKVVWDRGTSRGKWLLT